MAMIYTLLIASALLISNNALFAQTAAPEAGEVHASAEAKKKRKVVTIATKLGHAHDLRVRPQPLPSGKEWVDWISSLPDDENILNQIAIAAKKSKRPFSELRENGDLYFTEIHTDKRFFDKTNSSLGAQSRTLTTLSEIRRYPLRLSRSGSSLNIGLLNETTVGQTAEQIQDSITRQACKFRPYAIALVLGNCLWPKEDERHCDAPLSTTRLAKLWAMNQREAFELLLEKARFIEKAYEIYVAVKEQDIALPTISAEQIFSLRSEFFNLQVTDIKSVESLGNECAFDDVILRTIKSHIHCLRNARDNKNDNVIRCHQLAAARKEFMQFLEQRTQELQANKNQLTRLKNQAKDWIESIKFETSENSKDAELATKKAEVRMLTQMLKYLALRRSEYLQEMSRLEISDIPSPSPSPFSDFSPAISTQTDLTPTLPEAPSFEPRASVKVSHENEPANSKKKNDPSSRITTGNIKRSASSPVR